MGEQVMADGHRLSTLEMGVARHDPGRVSARLGSDRFDHIGERRNELRRGHPAVEPQVQGHLVVARTPGVKRRAGRGDLREAPLDRGVNVLVGLAELELSAVELALDPAQAALDCGQSTSREEACLGQPARMRDAPGDVERIELEIRLKR